MRQMVVCFAMFYAMK